MEGVNPKRFRKGLEPRDELIVERRDSDIILRKWKRKYIDHEFHKIKLIVEDELKNLGAEEGKHRYGVIESEDTRCRHTVLRPPRESHSFPIC